jgi:hypothetical protein
VLRERYEQDYLLPLARAMFELEPRCQSVLVTVGQYSWDDAADAVHSNELFCSEREPTWPAAGQVRADAIGNPDEIAELVQEALAHAPDEAYLAGLAEVQYNLWERARRNAFGDGYIRTLADDSEMIVAFASYCQEASDQEQPSWRSHRPYCLLRRPHAGEPLAVERVGTMVRPEWEDCWERLARGPLYSDRPTRLEERESLPTPPPTPPGQRSRRKLLLLLLLVPALAAAAWWLGYVQIGQ